MRIDLHYGPQSAAGTDRSSEKATGIATGSTGTAGSPEDQAQLSGTHAQVQALASEALQLPEIRQERVQSLREAIRSGLYDAAPGKTAGALIAHMAMRFTGQSGRS